MAQRVKLNQTPDLKGVPFSARPYRPLREVLGLCPANSGPAMYAIKDTAARPGPSLRRWKKRRRSNWKKTKRPPRDRPAELVEDQRTSTASGSRREEVQPEVSGGGSPPHPLPPVTPTDGARPAPPLLPPPPPHTGAGQPLQSHDISSCSEVEALQDLSHSRTKAKMRMPRKRRRITSKLSLSQNSLRHQHQHHHHHQQQQQRLDSEVQFLKEVVNNPASTSTSTSTSSSSSSQSYLSTTTTQPSRHITQQQQQQHQSVSGSESVFVSCTQTGKSQPAECGQQGVHRLSHKPGVKSSVAATTSLTRHHTSSEAADSRQHTSHSSTSAAHTVHGRSTCPRQTRPQASCARQQQDLSPSSSSEDCDQTVYHDAYSSLSLLEESGWGGSGVQGGPRHDSRAGPPQQDTTANTSDSSFSLKESDYTSTTMSSSSSGSTTFVAESVLSRTVLFNRRQPGNTQLRPAPQAPQGTHPSQARPHTAQCSSAPARGRAMPPPPRPTRRPTQKAEVDSSTSEEGPSPQPQQGARQPDLQPELRLSTSSGSSSSSSSVLLTPASKGCIQSVGEVMKHHFGGTLEENLLLLQRNNFNLLQCFMVLDKASASPPCYRTPARPHPH